METKKEYISVGGTPTESSLRQDATSAQRKAAKAAARSGASLPVADLNQWLHTPEREYYDLVRRSEIRDGAKKLRKQYLRYKEAEIIYSMSHKKLLELAGKAGAIVRIDVTVLIDRGLFDKYLEQFRERSTLISGKGYAR